MAADLKAIVTRSTARVIAVLPVIDKSIATPQANIIGKIDSLPSPKITVSVTGFARIGTGH